MQTTIINATNWLTTDSRRLKFAVISVAAAAMLLGIGSGIEGVLAGPATGGPH